MRPSTTSFLLATAMSVVTAQDDAYYFDTATCADGKGYAQCSKDAYSGYTDCQLNFCDPKKYSGSTSDCMEYVCKCTFGANLLTCAQTHCWNQVYSCEYQTLVNDMADSCLNLDLKEIPFFPAPDDAAGSCSCNIEKLMLAQRGLADGIQSCQEHILDKGSDSTEEMYAHCQCCESSGAMSVFYNVCPNTDPSTLGIDIWGDLFVKKNANWDQCASLIAETPCESLGYSAPGDKGAKFYAPGNFPANGTATFSNVAGAVTSPVSGAVYSYTMKNLETVISVASADARPTGKRSDGKDSKDSKSGDGKSGESNKDDKKDAAAVTVPRLVFAVVPVLVAAVVM